LEGVFDHDRHDKGFTQTGHSGLTLTAAVSALSCSPPPSSSAPP
jgi:hypothetical protein